MGHIVALPDRGFSIIEMIRRHEMAPVIADGRMPLGGSANLLGTGWNVGIEMEAAVPRPVAVITLRVVAQLYGSAFSKVDPDGEAFVVEEENFPGEGGEKEDDTQKAEKKALQAPTKAHL